MVCEHEHTTVVGKAHQIFAVLAGTLGSFGLGNVLGWTSPGLPSLQESQDLGNLNQTEKSWIASIAILGAILSGPIAGFLLNRFGRRGTMRLISLPFALGWLCIALAKWKSSSSSLIYVGRFITGLCGGAFTVIIPVFVSEIVDEELKGKLGSVMVLMCVLGILFSFIIGSIVSWFWLSLICCTCPLILFLATFIIPESYKYLLMKSSKGVKAEKAFRWYRGLDENEPLGKEFLNIIPSNNNIIGQKHEKIWSWKTLNTPFITKPVLICAALICCQQLGGINSVTMYTVDIFKSASENIDPNLASIGIGVVQVICVALSMILVDKVGRRVLLIGSSVMMSLSMMILGGYFYLKEQKNNEYATTLEHLSWIPILTLISFIVSYSIGMGPIPWLMVSELLNPKFKSELSAVITLIYWTLAFVAAKTYQDMILFFNESGCHLIFASFCIVAVFFTYFCVPETRGKTSTEIREHFGDLACKRIKIPEIELLYPNEIKKEEQKNMYAIIV